MLDITVDNGPHVLLYLQVTRLFRWTGTSVGLAAVVFALASDEIALTPYLLLLGWLLGVIAGEIAFPRAGGPIRRGRGIRLVPPQLTVAWLVCAAPSCGLALSTVLRSLDGETAFGERLGAAATLGLVAVVQLMVIGLHRRTLLAGPADLVGAEVATRSGSARWLLGAGASAALWTSVFALPLRQLDVVGLLVLVGLPIFAWAAASKAWQAGTPGGGSTWQWVTAGTVLAGMGLVLGWDMWQSAPGSPGAPPPEARTVPVRYATLDEQTGRWKLYGEGGQQMANRALPPTERRRAPFVLSGDGLHLVYVDEATHRLMLSHLSEPDERLALTGPLTGAPMPEVVMSWDGRYVSVGPELIDNRTGTRVRLPGVGRVLGFGPDGVMATAGRRALPGAPDTELLTLGYDGTVRTRAPFDPTLEVAASPDGRALVVLTDEEVLTMDPRTAVIRDHARLRVPEHYGAPEPQGWARDGRLLVRIEQDDDAEKFQLVDPATGKGSRVEGLPADLDRAIFGRIR
ncbi:hypothetical protein GBF35_05640 [Nonomuraea phyllanthi]|uniref:hypothetical protein n=1 Tax=Nonomuraea phyllanthi TaxID=2219224 RepID=UPI001293FB64|nr:hypothetical protein [Nonomuraea phyllanthi]QFY06226.1 hypothetical protein GBF35_05640 [Nonomuraea phyllanthi]